MTYLFDENWFARHQSKLLWLLNTPLIKIWFRWILRIRKFDCPLKTKIAGIAPNNFTFNQKLVLIDHIKLKKGWVIYDPTNRQHKRLRKSCLIEKRIALERTTDFRTHNKFSKRLFYAFYPVWWLAHQWDTLFANQWQPAWNLGFDTLTAGNTYYAGETLGAIQNTIPTGADAIIRVVGFAVDSDTLYFLPSSDSQSTVA
jgi:hypothetical protein